MKDHSPLRGKGTIPKHQIVTRPQMLEEFRGNGQKGLGFQGHRSHCPYHVLSSPETSDDNVQPEPASYSHCLHFPQPLKQRYQ